MRIPDWKEARKKYSTNTQFSWVSARLYYIGALHKITIYSFKVNSLKQPRFGLFCQLRSNVIIFGLWNP